MGEPNWKPLVAAAFAAMLALAGAWSSKKRPWEVVAGGNAALRTFALLSFPFVLAEVATGVASLATDVLSIPPLLGIGTAVDGGLLAAGVAAAILSVRRGQFPREPDSPR